jgi:hypothetical protein
MLLALSQKRCWNVTSTLGIALRLPLSNHEKASELSLSAFVAIAL